jgi:diacylglycerol kinase family enzyme
MSALSAAYETSATPTSGPRDAIALARGAASRGDAAVFAWGGDGTIREVVEGIHGSPAMLGVLPGGTFNVVALAIGLPRNPVEAARLLVEASPQPRDVGLIAESPFLMQATVGLDGFLMHRLRADLKARFGKAGVVVDGLLSFLRYRFPRFEVVVDGETHLVTGAAFVNMTEYAGSFRYVPGARWDDGVGHVVLFKGRSHVQALMFALAIALGRHHRRRDVLIKEARRLTIRAHDGLHVQTDGDPWRGELPATCELSPQRIQVLIPARNEPG